MEEQNRYINDFMKEKYDRLHLIVKKGRKEEIKKKADALGLSMNEYIGRLIDDDTTGTQMNVVEKMNKKALNKIKAAAFKEFKAEYTEEEFKALFESGKSILTAWRITEGTHTEIILTQHDTQINWNTLKNNGFTAEAEVEKIFYVDRQTKTLEFVGRV